MWATLHDQTGATECLDDSSALEPQEKLTRDREGRYDLVTGKTYAMRCVSSYVLQRGYVPRSPAKTCLRAFFANCFTFDTTNACRLKSAWNNSLTVHPTPPRTTQSFPPSLLHQTPWYHQNLVTLLIPRSIGPLCQFPPQ